MCEHHARQLWSHTSVHTSLDFNTSILVLRKYKCCSFIFVQLDSYVRRSCTRQVLGQGCTTRTSLQQAPDPKVPRSSLGFIISGLGWLRDQNRAQQPNPQAGTR